MKNTFDAFLILLNPLTEAYFIPKGENELKKLVGPMFSGTPCMNYQASLRECKLLIQIK